MIKTKSLIWNAVANYIGLGYTTIIGIVIFPLYLEYLGAEAFGLIGFFVVLTVWMQLLDMGMSPLLSRQAALARGQKIDFFVFKKLLRSIELIVFAAALIVALCISAGSVWIANSWLKVTSLALEKVTLCIELMGVMIGLRFFTSLYSSVIRGMENQVRLNVANTILITIKYVGAFLLLRFVTQDFVFFFDYQLLVSIIEFIVMSIMLSRLLPPTDKVKIRFFWNILRPMVPFAAGIAYTSIIWVTLTQIDKIILSNILLLSEYGYFALVAVVATGINNISAPISQAILPRMAYLLSQGKKKDMLTIYRKSTQLISVIILPLAGMVAIYSEPLLFSWTGDRKAAEWGGPILFWFALGNGILAISAFQYYLQFAHGKLKMHVIYNSITASIQIPIIIYVACKYGALGVAIAWFCIRLITFIIWPPIVHNKFAPGIHWIWLLKDILPFFVSTAALLLITTQMNIDMNGMDRIQIFSLLMGIGVTILMVNVLFSNAGREILSGIFKDRC